MTLDDLLAKYGVIVTDEDCIKQHILEQLEARPIGLQQGKQNYVRHESAKDKGTTPRLPTLR